MANFLRTVFDGLGLFVWTIWGLQERRFSMAFNVMSSIMVSMTTSLMVCLLSIQRNGRPETSSALLYVQS
ncbi:hypothetical protein L484_009390 [Morus notabilis]|uniref:Uncharacterized protein n=1 Tax=Morus notabilis TaxID=981085 RepID=W9RS67_9ROSA|nr:hypothetical protein L484_009390 [Morus notabilis]